MNTTNRWPAIFPLTRKACLLLTAVGALSTAPVKAAPEVKAPLPNWDLSGIWQLTQSNGAIVEMNLTQSGHKLDGIAMIGGPNGVSHTQGKVDFGAIAGNEFVVNVIWAPTVITNKETRASYLGKINEKGLINGSVTAGSATNESFSSTTAMKRLQPASMGTGSKPTSSTSTATSADESSSSDSEDSQ